MNLVAGIVKTVGAVLKGDWSGAWNGIKQITSAVVGTVITMVGNLLTAYRGVLSGLLAATSSTWEGIKSAASAAWSAIVSTVSGKASEVLATVSAIPRQIAGLGSMLIGSGMSLMNGFAQGIRNGIGAAIGAASDAVSAIRAFFPFSPAKKGPFSGRGWTLYSGRAIGAGLAQGLRQSRQEVARGANVVAEAAAIRAAVNRRPAGRRGRAGHPWRPRRTYRRWAASDQPERHDPRGGKPGARR